MPNLTAWIPVFTLLGIIAGAVIAGLFLLRRGRNDDRQARREPMPPSWAEIWARQNAQEEKIAALGRMIMSAVEQWPKEVDPPVFAADDLKILEDTLPTNWLRNQRSRPQATA